MILKINLLQNYFLPLKSGFRSYLLLIDESFCFIIIIQFVQQVGLVVLVKLTLWV
jgi:hypothetical protein